MGKWKIYTPDGVNDILTKDCYIKKNLEELLRKTFRRSAFFEIETPTIEFYDVFSSEIEITPQEACFKFFDEKGRILTLRPDMTIPVARVVSTKIKDKNYPIKISYIGNTYKFNEHGGGKQKEFTQAGAEILGIEGPEADAEVIALAIEALKELGLENFQIDIGQVEFFKGLMEETGFLEQEIEQIRMLIDSKDHLGVEEIVNQHDIKSELKELILSLPKLFGSIDVIENVKKLSINERSAKALENLKNVLEILNDYGVSKYVSVDLGMVKSINYYTGTIFKGFTYGVGFPILSGGRYDGLVERFGKKCVATGFSLGVNMIMAALERQGIQKEEMSIDGLVYYAEGGRGTAFSICKELRNQGVVIETYINKGTLEDAKNYAKKKGIGGVFYVLNSKEIEVHDIEKETVKKVDISQILGGNAL